MIPPVKKLKSRSLPVVESIYTPFSEYSLEFVTVNVMTSHSREAVIDFVSRFGTGKVGEYVREITNIGL